MVGILLKGVYVFFMPDENFLIEQAAQLSVDIRSHLPKFGNDIFSFQKFIKDKYGFWVNAYFDEQGLINTPVPFEGIFSINQNPSLSHSE